MPHPGESYLLITMEHGPTLVDLPSCTETTTQTDTMYDYAVPKQKQNETSTSPNIKTPIKLRRTSRPKSLLLFDELQKNMQKNKIQNKPNLPQKSQNKPKCPSHILNPDLPPQPPYLRENSTLTFLTYLKKTAIFPLPISPPCHGPLRSSSSRAPGVRSPSAPPSLRCRSPDLQAPQWLVVSVWAF